MGKPYDYYYLPDDKEIYCSELVQISYVTDDGKLIFSTIPMTFRNREGEIPEFWVKHYAKKGIAIPEGEPGTNPGELILTIPLWYFWFFVIVSSVMIFFLYLCMIITTTMIS